jgi:hypothetical protein
MTVKKSKRSPSRNGKYYKPQFNGLSYKETKKAEDAHWIHTYTNFADTKVKGHAAATKGNGVVGRPNKCYGIKKTSCSEKPSCHWSKRYQTKNDTMVAGHCGKRSKKTSKKRSKKTVPRVTSPRKARVPHLFDDERPSVPMYDGPRVHRPSVPMYDGPRVPRPSVPMYDGHREPRPSVPMYDGPSYNPTRNSPRLPAHVSPQNSSPRLPMYTAQRPSVQSNLYKSDDLIDFNETQRLPSPHFKWPSPPVTARYAQTPRYGMTSSDFQPQTEKYRSPMLKWPSPRRVGETIIDIPTYQSPRRAADTIIDIPYY